MLQRTTAERFEAHVTGCPIHAGRFERLIVAVEADHAELGLIIEITSVPIQTRRNQAVSHVSLRLPSTHRHQSIPRGNPGLRHPFIDGLLFLREFFIDWALWAKGGSSKNVSSLLLSAKCQVSKKHDLGPTEKDNWTD